MLLHYLRRLIKLLLVGPLLRRLLVVILLLLLLHDPFLPHFLIFLLLLPLIKVSNVFVQSLRIDAD